MIMNNSLISSVHLSVLVDPAAFIYFQSPNFFFYDTG